MSIEVEESMENGNALITIFIADRFDYNSHKLFIDTYQKYTQKQTQFVVDLSCTLFLDSSALGMLLMLNKWATHLGGSLTIKGAPPVVRQSLEISNFDKYMNIEG